MCHAVKSYGMMLNDMYPCANCSSNDLYPCANCSRNDCTHVLTVVAMTCTLVLTMTCTLMLTVVGTCIAHYMPEAGPPQGNIEYRITFIVCAAKLTQANKDTKNGCDATSLQACSFPQRPLCSPTLVVSDLQRPCCPHYLHWQA